MAARARASASSQGRKKFRVLPTVPFSSSNHELASTSSPSSFPPLSPSHSRSSTFESFVSQDVPLIPPASISSTISSYPLPRPPTEAHTMPNPSNASKSGSGSGSKSRSGSAARLSPLNTQAASGSIPAMPATSSASTVPNQSPVASAAPTASPMSSMSSPAHSQGSAQSPALGIAQSNTRERTLTHKSSSRTIGGQSVMSTATNVTVQEPTSSRSSRKASSASATTASSSKQTKDKDPSRTREREKDMRDREGRERGSEREKRPERHASGPSQTGVEELQRIPMHEAEPAPPTLMYWSRAPVWGTQPTHKMRSHSATVVDNTMIWMFGGCDDKEFWRDVLCLDVETMEMTRPETIGDIPPPCRAHTATLVDRRLFVFGGGQGNMYYNSLFILDTVSRRWTQVPFSSPKPLANGAESPSSDSDAPSSAANGNSSDDTLPRPRRAHTTVLYKTKLVVFGGGNGAMALNDVWVLDVSVPVERMKWAKQRTTGARPTPRGYHTANLIGNVMVVVGGSDGRQTFSDIFCLNLDTWHWSSVHADKAYRRLAHTATQIGSYLFIMGGHDGSQYTNELLLFNLVSLQYEPRQTRGIPPGARGYHASALSDGRLWLFGGYDGRAAHDDVHMLDLASSAYLSQVTGFQINVD